MSRPPLISSIVSAIFAVNAGFRKLAQLTKGELRLPARVAALDREIGGRIAAVIASGDFRGKSGQTTCL